MRHHISLALAFGLTLPALVAAEDAPAKDASSPPAASATATPAPETFSLRRIDVGAETVGVDTSSSRFREYRVLPDGLVLPYVHFGGNERFWYDILGENVLQKDAHYRVDVEPGPFGITAEYRSIPHLFDTDAHSLLSLVGPGQWAMSDTLQQTFQTAITNQFAKSPAGVSFDFLNKLVTPSLAATPPLDVSLLRERGSLELRLTRDKPLDVRVTYFQEKRSGDRPAGTSFGFGNVVETGEPIDYRTRDYGLSAEWHQAWGLIRGSAHYNEFTNHIPTESFDNPFRATDSTDASAYSSPGSGSIGGPAVGRVSLPPDNKAMTESLGVMAKFAGHSRVSVDAALGQWMQDQAFMPLTSNSAIPTPNQTLPDSLDGKVHTYSLSAALTSQPVSKLHLTARYRRYDLSNDTPPIELPVGYVRFDAAFENIPRSSVPYGHATDALVLSAAYDLGKVSLEGGYKLNRTSRTFRETESTTENVGFLKVDVHPWDWMVLRGSAEKGSRGYNGLDIELSEEASLLQPGLPDNLLAVPAVSANPAVQQMYNSLGCSAGAPCNLRFDQAPNDVGRYGAYLELSPHSGKATLTVAYLKANDDYPQSVYGLTKSDNESLTVEADVAPFEGCDLNAFYTRENIDTAQRGRQSGATVSASPLDDWTSDVTSKVDSFGGGATIVLQKEKLDLKLFGDYQKVDGNNDIASPAGGAPALARATIGGVASIPLFDDTKIYTLSAELAYRATKRLTMSLGGRYERYVLRDSSSSDATDGILLANYVPGSFFLAGTDGDYKAHVLYVRASYVW
jgi:MtrB/PioB family decaheme-associated outer membrane protein